MNFFWKFCEVSDVDIINYIILNIKSSPYLLHSELSYIFNFFKRKFSTVIPGGSDYQFDQLWPWLDAYWLEYFISGGFLSFLFLHSAWNRPQNYVFGQFCVDHPLKPFFFEENLKIKKKSCVLNDQKKISTRYHKNIDTHFWVLKFLISNRLSE